jgi:pyruvate dehydrogenase E2 component (dihydrolipoamide acetyltransferase)
MAEIVMPRLSDTMEEGTVVRWLKADGDLVARGEELVEIETDKATMTYESDQAGVLDILAAEGQTLEVGALIARVGDAGEKTIDEPASPAEGVRDAGPPADERHAPATASALEPVLPADGGGRVKASPLARRMARESGVDLHGLAGSGPGGRIVKADVLAASGRAATTPAPAPAAPTDAPQPADITASAGAPAATAAAPALEGVMTAKGETTTLDLSRTQQAVARRMAESKATIPDFTLQMDIDMEACVALRAELKGLSASQAPTYNDMVVKAAALALREHPRANGSYRDGQVHVYSRVNVGVAVAAEGALVVPTVFDADEKSLGEIARETRALAEHVRDATITPPQLGGGTFTVSNLGMYGVRSFTAIINPPQAAILSVGSLEPRAVARDGGLTIRNTMTLTLACDHRILYGADAAQFLARIRQLLEAPAALTL